MKKGEMRRKEILDAAEKLFMQKGYEATSVQDILDALQLSKGGFYHHFETKKAVLEAISQRRVESQFEDAALELRGSRASAVERLNALLTRVNLFEREEIPFIALLLRVCYREGDSALKERMKSATIRTFLPLMDEIVTQGVGEKTFYSRHPGRIGQIVLTLAQDLIDEAAQRLAAHSGEPECVIEIMELLNAYRDSVELLLNAPYGSISIFDPARLLEIFRAVMRELDAKVIPEIETEERKI